MAIIIDPVKPPVDRYDYTNPHSQGALITQTSNWPKAVSYVMHRHRLAFCPDDWNAVYDYMERMYSDHPVEVPRGLEIDSFHMDRLEAEDRKRLMTPIRESIGEIGGGIVTAFQVCSRESLIAGVASFSGKNVTSVRVVYYFNEATGYDCIRIDYLYKK